MPLSLLTKLRNPLLSSHQQRAETVNNKNKVDMKYTLTDTFNNWTISRHRTIAAAIAAETRHLKAVKRANGASSYLTYEITSSTGEDIRSEVESARESEWIGRNVR
jgi:hypothetical protein